MKLRLLLNAYMPGVPRQDLIGLSKTLAMTDVSSFGGGGGTPSAPTPLYNPTGGAPRHKKTNEQGLPHEDPGLEPELGEEEEILPT